MAITFREARIGEVLGILVVFRITIAIVSWLGIPNRPLLYPLLWASPKVCGGLFKNGVQASMSGRAGLVFVAQN